MSRHPVGDEQLQEWAALRLDGEIDDLRWGQLLQAHPQVLEQALQEHRRIGDAIRAQARPAADPLLRQAILARIPWSKPAVAPALTPSRSRTWHPARWISAAALAACLVVALHLEQRSSAVNPDLAKRIASTSLPQRPPADVIEAGHEQDAPQVAMVERTRHQELSASLPSPAPTAQDAQAAPPASSAVGGVTEEHPVGAVTTASSPAPAESPAAPPGNALASRSQPDAPGADVASASPPEEKFQKTAPATESSPAAPTTSDPVLAMKPSRSSDSEAEANKDLVSNAAPSPLAAPEQPGQLRQLSPDGHAQRPDEQSQDDSTQPSDARHGPKAATSHAVNSWRATLSFGGTSAPRALQLLIRRPGGTGIIPAHGLALIGFDQGGQLVWKHVLDAPAQDQVVDEAHPYRLTVPLVDQLQPPVAVASISLQLPAGRSVAIPLPSATAAPSASGATTPAATPPSAPAR